MHLTHIVSFFVSAIFAALITAPLPAVLGQTQDGAVQRAAEVRVGSCDALGDIVAQLVPLSAPAGDVLGQAGVTPVEQSATQVPIPLENLLAKDHVVIAHTAPEEIFAPVSCGPIGGAFNDQGALVVSLDAMNGSRINGVAYFLPVPETASTVVTLMLTPRNAAEPGATDSHDPNVPDVVVVDGVDGVDGADGADSADVAGSNGADGADAAGSNGMDGADAAGSNGMDGADAAGSNGVDGADGADGVAGADGADGVAGADGQDGQPGQPGQPGADGTGGHGGAGGNGGDGGDGGTGVAGGDGGAGGAGADAVVEANG